MCLGDAFLTFILFLCNLPEQVTFFCYFLKIPISLIYKEKIILCQINGSKDGTDHV